MSRARRPRSRPPGKQRGASTSERDEADEGGHEARAGRANARRFEKKIEELRGQDAGAAACAVQRDRRSGEAHARSTCWRAAIISNKGDRVGMRPAGRAAARRRAGTAGRHAKAARTSWPSGSTDPENPLTARVMVNRIWQYHFGRGIVGTPNDFGRMGERAHASRTAGLSGQRIRVHRGWSVKRVHRLILLSNAYRQASTVRTTPRRARRIPTTGCCGDFSRRRLEAEEIRDAMLAVSGTVESEGGRAERDRAHRSGTGATRSTSRRNGR